MSRNDDYQNGWYAGREDGLVRGEEKGRAACAALVRENARIEREVGETWDREAKQAAPGADAVHLKACKTRAFLYAGFSDRLESLAQAIEARRS